MAASKSRLVAAITRTFVRMDPVPPTRPNSCSCRTRKRAIWVSAGSSPISSRKMVPPSANSKRPKRRWVAPVKAPFSWPNNSDAMQVAWNCGAVNTDKRSRGTLRAFVDSTCDQFFARPRFAGDQNGGVCRSNLGDTREYRVQGGRNPHDLLEHRCPIYFFAQRNVLVAESLLSLLAILDISPGDIPTCDASLFIS